MARFNRIMKAKVEAWQNDGTKQRCTELQEMLYKNNIAAMVQSNGVHNWTLAFKRGNDAITVFLGDWLIYNVEMPNWFCLTDDEFRAVHEPGDEDGEKAL